MHSGQARGGFEWPIFPTNFWRNNHLKNRDSVEDLVRPAERSCSPEQQRLFSLLGSAVYWVFLEKISQLKQERRLFAALRLALPSANYKLKFSIHIGSEEARKRT